MNRTRLKLTVVGFALIAAVSILAIAGVQDGLVYFLPVDEFVQKTDQVGKRIRLHGEVGEANIQISDDTMDMAFDLNGESSSLRINYTGVVPDMFKPGHEVVVEGKLNESGVFEADTLLTKCASKYESDGDAPHADPTKTGYSE